MARQAIPRSQRAGRTPPKRSGLLRLAGGLFVLLLGAAGAWQAWLLGDSLLATWQGRQWVEVPARLESWQSRTTGTATVRLVPGGMVPQRLLTARYHYAVAGREMTGGPVALRSLHDNFSDRHRDRIVAQLRQAEADGGKLTVWVDPADPARVAIDRRLPLAASLFSALMLLMPCGLASLVVLGLLAHAVGRLLRRELRPLALPLWALLHGLPALPIALLAAPGDISPGPAALLLVLAALALAGAVAAIRVLARGLPPAPG